MIAPGEAEVIQRVAEPTEAALKASWEAAFGRDYIRPLVASALVDGRVVLPYDLLHRAAPDLADCLVAQPTLVLFAGEWTLAAMGYQVPLRISAYGPSTPISSLRSEHVGRLIAIEGLVKRASEVRSRIEDALFRCLRCDCLLQEAQDEHLVLKEPLQCYEDQGGCGKSTGFKLATDKSRFVDSQTLEVQEAPDALRGGDVPQRLSTVVELDLCGLVRPGDRVVMTGILRLHSRKRGNAKTTLFERHLRVVHVEARQQAYEDVPITREDEAHIRALAASADIYDQLAASIAPSLYGLEAEKLAIALLLFGAVRKQNPDGTSVRGDIHIGLLGDPGIAKSQMLRYAAKLSLRGIYTDGTGSSGAGLTAGAVKDEEDGRWTYEAGAMPLAHGGLCCIDEADKMDKKDRAHMLTALEQGIVKLTKTGLDVELPAQTSVLLAGNPKDGRFDLKYAAISEQIDLPVPLLSRLDLIFVMLDRVDEARDRATMEHIVFRDADTPTIPIKLLRKYIAYARRTCEPVLSREAGQRIVDYYVALRRKKTDSERVVVTSTPREGEALRRLAQAAARVRLSPTVEVRDVGVAVGLMDECLERMDWDTDKAIGGMGATKRDAVHAVITLVAALEEETEHGAPAEQLVRRAWEEHKIPEIRVREILEELRVRSRVTEPRNGHYRKV